MYGRCLLDISVLCVTLGNVDNLIKADSYVNRCVNGLLSYIHIATCTNVQFVILLMEMGADINCHGVFGNVPLIVSVNCSNIGAARYLIDNQCIIDECNNN